MSDKLPLIFKTFLLIKETPSRLKKDKLMKTLIAMREVKPLLREILIYTFHPYWNYWVKVKSNNYREIGTDFGNDTNWFYLKKLLDSLKNREITGDKARDNISNFLDNIPTMEAFWFAQIINRDIKIGMQLKSFEKHLGELVPKFSPMLAATWDKKEIKEKVAIEPKLDGIRCICLFPKGETPTTVSRNGRPIYNTEHILNEFKGTLEGYVLDGELEGRKKGWGHGISGAHSKNKKVSGLKLTVFDILTMEEWEKRKCRRSYLVRRNILTAALKTAKPEHAVINDAQIGYFSKKEMSAIRDEYIARGIEGIVIKSVAGRYEFKRSKNWLKSKFKETIDCRVVGRTKGKAGTRVEHLIGALIVEGKIDGQKFQSEVGQGLKDSDRKYFAELSESELKRHVVEIEHYGLTGSLRLKQSDKLPAVRNGIFLRIREDKMER